jgi:general stress protein CsbA
MKKSILLFVFALIVLFILFSENQYLNAILMFFAVIGVMLGISKIEQEENE